MKNLFIYSFLGFFLLCGNSLSGQTNLRSGEIIPVKFNSEVSAKRSFQPVNVVVAQSIYSGENLLISQGTPVEVSVQSQKPASNGRPGTLSIIFLSTRAVDGSSVPLSGAINMTGEDKSSRAAGLSLGLGLGLGLTFLPIVGFAFFGFYAMKGGDAVILQNTIVRDVFVTRNCLILDNPLPSRE